MKNQRDILHKEALDKQMRRRKEIDKEDEESDMFEREEAKYEAAAFLGLWEEEKKDEIDEIEDDFSNSDEMIKENANLLQKITVLSS